MLAAAAASCTRPAEAPPPRSPEADLAEADPAETDLAEADPPAEADPLDDLGSQDQGRAQAPPAARPEPIEVVVDAVFTAKKDGARLLEVGADARFTLNLKIEAVEPPTPLLEPGYYDVLIHSPSKTFRGPVPGKGERVRFRLSIYPEDPADPHDETFFASLWVE
ncbi:MAG: hypothetical protein KDK70_21585 [Myxococcales bacterium]|nr:hypothetical protein [Myxococcales bacterium]